MLAVVMRALRIPALDDVHFEPAPKRQIRIGGGVWVLRGFGVVLGPIVEQIGEQVFDVMLSAAFIVPRTANHPGRIHPRIGLFFATRGTLNLP